MKTFRCPEAFRSALKDVPAMPVQRMTHAEEVQALMSKGMKIVRTRGYTLWAFAPKAIAYVCGAPYSAAFPADDDLNIYKDLGGEIVTIA